MIVLNNKEPMKELKNPTEEKETFMTMFRKELDAYCAYKDWLEEVDEDVLEMAITEIMEDEYLHARFLRNFMIEHHMYNIEPTDPYEKKFLKLEKEMFI